MLLSIGMVSNQMATESSIHIAGKLTETQQDLAAHTLAAEVGLRKMQIAVRSVRLAKTPVEVEKRTTELRDAKAEEEKEIEAALTFGREAGQQGAASEDQIADGHLRRCGRSSCEGARSPASAARPGATLRSLAEWAFDAQMAGSVWRGWRPSGVRNPVWSDGCQGRWTTRRGLAVPAQPEKKAKGR